MQAQSIGSKNYTGHPEVTLGNRPPEICHQLSATSLLDLDKLSVNATHSKMVCLKITFGNSSHDMGSVRTGWGESLRHVHIEGTYNINQLYAVLKWAPNLEYLMIVSDQAYCRTNGGSSLKFSAMKLEKLNMKKLHHLKLHHIKACTQVLYFLGKRLLMRSLKRLEITSANMGKTDITGLQDILRTARLTLEKLIFENVYWDLPLFQSFNEKLIKLTCLRINSTNSVEPLIRDGISNCLPNVEKIVINNAYMSPINLYHLKHMRKLRELSACIEITESTFDIGEIISFYPDAVDIDLTLKFIDPENCSLVGHKTKPSQINWNIETNCIHEYEHEFE